MGQTNVVALKHPSEVYYQGRKVFKYSGHHMSVYVCSNLIFDLEKARGTAFIVLYSFLTEYKKL